MANCKHHPNRESIGACQCGRVICEECIRQETIGPAVGGGRGFNMGCVECLPSGEKPPSTVVDFMKRDFIRRASGK
jgi:hypothetical protein